MKKSLILVSIILMAAFTFQTCGDEEDPNGDGGSDPCADFELVGTWVSDELDVSGGMGMTMVQTITYNADCSFTMTSEIDDTNSLDKGCTLTDTITGTYTVPSTSGVVPTMEATSGTTEISDCTDSADDQAETAKSAADLTEWETEANTSNTYTLSGNTFSVEISMGEGPTGTLTFTKQ